MEAAFNFILALISAGFPLLAGIVVLAIAFRMTGPIRVRVSIGERSKKPMSGHFPSKGDDGYTGPKRH